MRTVEKNAGKVLAAVGAMCLLLGAFARAPKSEATTAAAAQTMGISGTATQHWSYGQFDMTQAGWIAANSRDNWGSGAVPYSLVQSRWLACILHSFEAGHFVEVVWQWDSAL